MRFFHSRSMFWHVLILAALLTTALSDHQRLSAQYFPNTQPITYNPYGMGPYGNTVAGWGANARLNLRALPAIYSQQLQNAGAGYNVVQPYSGNSFGGGGYNQNWGNSNYYNYNYSYSPYGYGR